MMENHLRHFVCILHSKFIYLRVH